MHVFLLGLFVQVMSLLYNKSISLKQLIKQIEVKLKALASPLWFSHLKIKYDKEKR